MKIAVTGCFTARDREGNVRHRRVPGVAFGQVRNFNYQTVIHEPQTECRF
jgi:hypothetical protein